MKLAKRPRKICTNLRADRVLHTRSHHEKRRGNNSYNPQSVPDRPRASPQVELKVEEMSVRRASWRAPVNQSCNHCTQDISGYMVALSREDEGLGPTGVDPVER
uniref:Uncharacterized protein n=1 Tax=Steinernema glaseri TaxID=37863 RepID=A0A1I7YAX1_9BILA